MIRLILKSWRQWFELKRLRIIQDIRCMRGDHITVITNAWPDIQFNDAGKAESGETLEYTCQNCCEQTHEFFPHYKAKPKQ